MSDKLQIEGMAEILASLERQFPGKAALSRVETAKALSYRNPATIDRLRARGLLKANRATRRPTFTLPAIAEFLASTR